MQDVDLLVSAGRDRRRVRRLRGAHQRPERRRERCARGRLHPLGGVDRDLGGHRRPRAGHRQPLRHRRSRAVARVQPPRARPLRGHDHRERAGTRDPGGPCCRQCQPAATGASRWWWQGPRSGCPRLPSSSPSPSWCSVSSRTRSRRSTSRRSGSACSWARSACSSWSSHGDTCRRRETAHRADPPRRELPACRSRVRYRRSQNSLTRAAGPSGSGRGSPVRRILTAEREAQTRGPRTGRRDRASRKNIERKIGCRIGLKKYGQSFPLSDRYMPLHGSLFQTRVHLDLF